MTFRAVILFVFTTENASSIVYGITDAKVALFCKIYERLIFVTASLYLATPAVLKFWTSQKSSSQTIVHLDVGFFNDL